MPDLSKPPAMYDHVFYLFNCNPKRLRQWRSVLKLLVIFTPERDRNIHFLFISEVSTSRRVQSIIEAFGIAGIFAVDESHKSLTICPRHRAEYGIR